MLQTFRDAKKVIAEFYTKFGVVTGFTLLTSLGLFLYILGYSHSYASSSTGSNAPWWARGAIDLGRMILIGAIISAFIRFLHTFQAIRDVVIDVFFADELLKRRKDLDTVWAKLSKHIFLPDFAADERNDGKLQDDIVEQLRIRMSHNTTFHVKSIDRTITVSWHDREQNLVKIVDASREEFVPFRKGGEVHWQHVFYAGDNATAGSYSPEMSVVVDGRTVEPEVEGSASDRVLKFSYRMTGRDLYAVTKKTTRQWNISSDPLIVYISRHVVLSLRLQINCLEDDIVPFFEEHHLINKFSSQSNDAIDRRPSDYATSCSSPILPGEGYTICLIRVHKR
ncbi:hypothetical protein [Pararhodobacter sp.]|uniref:hypothetical protein n=1 Tax=Pararhodobacter sp. TaxID=2127056 RepID=UPI002AFE7428|nr:hypothetical protein [Pararhodobacter sp.]